MSNGNGLLPEGWEEATLGDLGDWKGGGTPSKSNSAFWTNGDVPWVSPKDMKRFCLDDAEDHITSDAVKSSSAQLLPADSILVVTRSGILQRILPIAINLVPVATNQDLKALVPNEGINSRYIAYMLKARDRHLRNECSKDGTTVASIDLPKLKAYRFGLAPEAEQRRIVSKIESLQERSSRAREALSEVGPLLEQFRQSVLQAAFSGRLTADWRAARHLPAPKEGRWYAYAIECDDDSIYIGMTDDLPNRWKQHREGKGAQWTKTHQPRYVIHWEQVDSREAAAKREKELKSGYGRKWLKREREAGRLRQAGDVEPASELLQRIRTERRHRWEQWETFKYEVRRKKVPKNIVSRYDEPESSEGADTSDVPEIPSTWCWATVDEVGIVGSGKRLPKGSKLVSNNTGFPYIRAGNLKGGTVRGEILYLTEEDYQTIPQYNVNAGDNYLTIVGASIGDAGTIPAEFDGVNLTENAAKVMSVINGAYLGFILRSPPLQDQIQRKILSAAQGKLALGRIKQLVVPVPPIAEQTQIAALVTDLLERTEDAIRDAISYESSLAQLDQSILAKAFRGELVPQDPRDEPASELIARIRAAREADPKKKPRSRKASKKEEG